MMLDIKRVYEPPESDDGIRILVDRLWPRGISKERAMLDKWIKDIAPSPELRTWFGHKTENFEDFAERYRIELETDPIKQTAVIDVLEMAKENKLTLVYAAKSLTVNHAAVLRDYLIGKNSLLV